MKAQSRICLHHIILAPGSSRPFVPPCYHSRSCQATAAGLLHLPRRDAYPPPLHQVLQRGPAHAAASSLRFGHRPTQPLPATALPDGRDGWRQRSSSNRTPAVAKWMQGRSRLGCSTIPGLGAEATGCVQRSNGSHDQVWGWGMRVSTTSFGVCVKLVWTVDTV